ncbi:MAG: HAMP domain-containing sensor histidine kinase, partial [Pseudomonadota bacterium]
YILGIARDVTEREKMFNELEAKNEELTSFAYRTSHDLKGPLTTIKRLANYIEQDIKAGNSDEAITNIARVKQQSIHLTNLITDILDLAKSNQKDYKNTSFNVIELINRITSKHEALIQDNQVEINIVCKDSQKMFSEELRIEQILENLITNGVKYANANNKYININFNESRDKYSFTVKDNGIGIPEGTGENIYKLFTRYDQNSDGSGIGMTIVKRNIDSLSGEIKYESSNFGTIFTITIPKQDNEKDLDE